MTTEITIEEWIKWMSNDATLDVDLIQKFLANLQGYKGAPTYADQVQFLNFITAIRIHEIQTGKEDTS